MLTVSPTAFPYHHPLFHSTQNNKVPNTILYMQMMDKDLQIFFCEIILQKRKWTIDTTCPLNASMMNWSDWGWTHSMHFCTTWFPFWSFTHFRTWPSSSFTISFWKNKDYPCLYDDISPPLNQEKFHFIFIFTGVNCEPQYFHLNNYFSP